MRNRILTGFLAAGVAMTFAACQVTKTEDGEAPEIDPGSLPKYDVDAPDVTIGADTTQVITPDIDINRDTTRDTTTAN